MTDRLFYEELTYKIRGALFNIYNDLGFGHKELIYQRALAKELDRSKLSYKREPKLNVEYRGEVIGKYVPDFLVDNKVVVELKSSLYFPPDLGKQLINYLKVTGYKLALAVNFGNNNLVIKRFIWSNKSV